MATQENSPKDKRPEGLTENQEALAGMLFEAKQTAPVTRRITQPDGSFIFEKIERPTSPIDFAQEGEFALKMHEIQPDAPLSPIYVNLRNLPESLVNQVGLVLSEIPTGEPVDFCAGIPKAGILLAEAYSRYSEIPVVDIFGKEDTGSRRKIVAGAGIDTVGTNVRLVDDLATGGETKLEAKKAAEKMGYKVQMLVLIDRQQGAIEKLRKEGLDIRAAMTINQILRYGLRVGMIGEELFYKTRNYLLTNRI